MGLLSVSGTSASDVYAVGTDPDDGLGPYVVHFDGQRWTRLNTAASGDLWWIATPMVGDSFFMAGAGGLILRYQIDRQWDVSLGYRAWGRRTSDAKVTNDMFMHRGVIGLGYAW